MELDPKCIKGEIPFAITNRYQLIPCCRLDDLVNANDPEYLKLLSVSTISDENTIEQILSSTEWIDFVNNLKNNKGPAECFRTCGKNKLEKAKRIIYKIHPNTNTIAHIDTL